MSKIARDNRNRNLARIHVLKKELLEKGTFQSEEDYRAMLWAQARVKSSADLDHAGRMRVLAHMESLTGGSSTARPKRKPLSAKQRLMWSLWQQLADAGLVTDRRMPALVSFVKRQTGVDKLEWLKAPQESLVIESLKTWLERKAA